MLKILLVSALIVTLPIFAKDRTFNGLEKLKAGNLRYTQDKLQHPSRTSARRESVASKQEPFAIIVGCSDSRVPPEILFDQGVGDLFIVRVAGNVIGDLELESIQYGVLNLHASTIVVLGHENCGAVDAVLSDRAQSIPALSALIQPAVSQEREQKAPNLLEASVKTNALNMRDLLKQNSAFQKLLKSKKLNIYAGYYHLDTGAVEWLQ